jgi:putative heme degradation protein
MHTDVTFTGKTGAENSLLLRRLAAFKSLPETEQFARDTKTTTGKVWSSSLSIQEFCERVSLLSQLELPCVIHIANPAVEQLCSGVIRRIERTEDRLGLLGDGFALHLRMRNMDSIRLVSNSASDDGAMAVEIYSKAGALITRIFGIQDRVGNAVWQDVMGNPSLCVA